MSTGVKVTLIILVVVVLLVLTCLGTCVGFGVWAATRPPPEGITADITHPTAIAPGQSFDYVITLTNAQPEERTLIDIDFMLGLLEGVSVTNITPTPESDLDMGGFMKTYTFNDPIPANGQLVLTFEMTADTAGTYEGTVDIAVDSVLSVLSVERTLTIGAGGPTGLNETIDDATDAIGDAIENAGDSVEEAADDASNAIRDAVEDATSDDGP